MPYRNATCARCIISTAGTDLPSSHARWDEVAQRIRDGAVAILPVGTAAKQHGFHLPLDTDRIQAEWLAAKMAEKIDALIWPTLAYGHYPAFVEYAGNSSLSDSTFETLVREIAGQVLPAGGGAR